MCVLCWSASHVPECRCYICESAAWFFWPAPPPKEIVETTITAKHSAKLGLSQRQVAARAGLSKGVVAKASHPGSRLLVETAEKILAVHR